MDTLPTVLLLTAISAFVLMGVTCFCGLMFFRIAQKSLEAIHKNNKELYLQILNGRISSWIERGCYSVIDIRIWWNLYLELYRGGKIDEVIGRKTRLKARRYARTMLTCFATAMLLAIIVVFTGFVIVSNQTT